MAEALSHSAPNDGTALELFQRQWGVYRKFLQYDYLANARACAALRGYLLDEVKRPFEFLDLACGDASGVAAALKGLPVTHYRGVDLSAPALGFARASVADLACEVDLVEADFSDFLRAPVQQADIVWISLSLHHLDTVAKLDFMRTVRANLAAHGGFLAYEPARRDGEDRPAYLDRLEGVGRRDWTALSTEEFSEGIKHVRTYDLPETVSVWRQLGEDAGFSSSTVLYVSPDDLFRLVLYRP